MAKASTPVSERKQPETFCLNLGIRRSRYGRVVVAGNAPASFVGMGHWRGDECAANRGDWHLRAGGGHPYGALEGAR